MDGQTDDFTNDTGTTGALEVGSTASGTIDFLNDQDWFAIELTAGEIVRFASDGSLSDIALVHYSGTFFIGFDQYDSNSDQDIIIAQIFESGTYFIAVNGGSNTSLDYTLSATLVEDDFADDATTMGLLAIDSMAAGAVDYRNDTDWFAIDLTAGEAVRIASDSFNANLVLRDEFGNSVTFDYRDSDTNENVINAQVSESGTYYIDVTGSNSPLDYTLTATLLTDDFANTTSTTGTLDVGGTTTGTINFRNDSDFFAIELTAGDAFRIASAGFDTNLVLLNEVGNVVTFGYSDFDTNETVIISQIAVSGTYYVAVNSFNSPLDYTLTATALEDDFSNNTSTTGVLDVGGTITGTINFRNDEDFFAIELTASEIVSIASDGSSADITLMDEFGNVVATDLRDFGTNQDVIIAQVEESGIYYIVVDGDSNSALDYTLSATLIADDFLGNSNTTAVLAVGGAATGTIDYLNDEDWFAIELTAGEVVRIASDGTAADINLRDEFGNFLASDQRDFSANQDVLIAQVTETGTYYISVDGDSNSALDYTLTASLIDDDFTGDTNTTGVLEVDGAAVGEIDFRDDEDWFAIELTAGEISRIASDGFSAGITLRDEFGNTVLSDQYDFNTGQNVLIAQVDVSGTYYISVDGGSNPSLEYALTATLIQDDFGRDTDTTGILEIGGAVTGAIEYLNDEDWFAIELTTGEAVRIASAGFDADLILRDAFGNSVVFDNRDNDTNENVLIALVEESGTYYIAVDSSDSTLEYTLTATILQDDFTNNSNTIGALAVGGMTTGVIDFRDDEDWFAIDLTSGEAVRIASTDRDADLVLVDEFGNSVTFNYRDFNSNENVLIAQVEESGTYYVVVDSSDTTLNYTLTAIALQDDFVSNANTTGILDVGGTATGAIEFRDDADWFAITISDTNSALRFIVDNADVDLSIFDANGDLVTSSPEGRSITFAEAGTYFVVADSSSDSAEYTITSIVADTTDATLIVANTGIVDTVADEASDITYSLTNDGTLIRYSNQTETLLSNLELGVATSALSLSQDGRYLFAAQSDLTDLGNNISEATIFRINTETLEIESFLFEVTGDRFSLTEISDIQTAADGTLFVTTDFSGSGWVPLYNFSGFDSTPIVNIIEDSEFTFGNSVRQRTTFDISRDGQFLLLAESNSTPYTVYVYSVEDGAVIASTRHSGFNSDRNAISGEASLVVAAGYNEVIVYDFNFNSVADLTGVFGDRENVYPSFSQNGEYLLLVSEPFNGDPSVAIIDTSSFEVLSFIDLPQNISSISEVDISPDGLSLVITDSSGVHYLDLSNKLGVSTVEGTTSDDALIGTDFSDLLIGLAGDDVLEGGSGADTLNGGAGNDTASYANSGAAVIVDLGAGSADGGDATGDSLTSIENISGSDNDDIVTGDGRSNTLLGAGGNDILEGGGGAMDILDGGSGIDTAVYTNSTNRVDVSLLAGTASGAQSTGDVLISIENLTGSSFGDTLRGAHDVNFLDGGSGNDILIGYNGDDHLLGGAGRDILNGGNGADIIDGGAGVDMARYNGSTEAVQIDLLAGTASGGQAAGDVLIGIENLFGSNYDDTLSGDGNNNQIFGHNGDDALSAGGGISKLFGGAGADSFALGDGFAFIMDFADDVDQLDVSAYGFATLAEALDNLDQVGAHARFRVGDDVLLVLNTDMNDLMDDIFI